MQIQLKKDTNSTKKDTNSIKESHKFN